MSDDPQSAAIDRATVKGRCILVLGMHRSGTSMLSGTLRSAGVYMGRVLDHPFDLNPTGLQEPESLIYMHENLLETNGGSWHAPPSQLVWGKLHTAVRDLFIESRESHPIWGFKEPRTLLTAEGWIDALSDWKAVGIFRHPAEVAASMKSRNTFDMEKGLALWEIYNRRLLELQRKHCFPVIEFSKDPALMHLSLRKVLLHLGLNTAFAEEIYSAAIPRQTESSLSKLPESTAALLADLRSVCL